MATTAAPPIVFIVPGQAQPVAATRGAAAALCRPGLLRGVAEAIGARRRAARRR